MACEDNAFAILKQGRKYEAQERCVKVPSFPDIRRWWLKGCE